MTGSRVIKFAQHNAIALLALFVALGGTGYAAISINGSSIKNGSIAGKKLKRHTLTGTQIKLSKLGTVPAAKHATTATSAGSAATATNAVNLGGVPAAGYLKRGCGAGNVGGYAMIRGDEGLFPATYTTSSTYLSNTFNCSGQPVEVRQYSTGVFDIQFPGNPGTLGFGSPQTCVSDGPLMCIARGPETVTVTNITTGADAGGFQVVIRNSINGDEVNDGANVLIP